MADHARPTKRSAKHSAAETTAPESRRRPVAAPQVLPLVMVCSVLLAAGMAFGNPFLWVPDNTQPEAQDAPAPDTAASEGDSAPEPETPQTTEQVVIGEYHAVSQSDEEGRAENLRLAAEAVNGTVIQPGEEFSFNDTVGNTSSENGYQDAPVIRNGEMAEGSGGGVCQVSTALYIAAVKADLEITERHPHSVPSDYASIGLDATVVYDLFDLRIRNNTDSPITIYADAMGQTVDVRIVGDPLPEGRTIDAVSQVVSQYQRDDGLGHEQQYYVTESFRVYYQDGVRTTRDLLSSDIYIVDDDTAIVLGEGSVEPNK